MNVILFLSCFISFRYSSFAQHNIKRILLNDQDFADRLHHMEQTLMKLVSDNLQLQQRQQSDNLQLQQTIQQLVAENNKKSQRIEHLESAIQNTGSTYIRWGTSHCPNNTAELVYSGYAGGGMFDQTGSAAEYVCLPQDPNFVKTSGNDGGRMYGGEYESNFWASNSHDEDVPCALCRKPYTSTTIMIPGKNECYNGWNREYYGYLASGYYIHQSASSYVCVDINPEYLQSGIANNNGKLFYSVLAKCGSLPCPPYFNDYPLTCVVCSK